MSSPAASGTATEKGGRWSKVAARAVVDRNLTATHVRVLGVLGIYAGPDGIAWPSQETIAFVIGVDRATVCRAVKRLRELGYIDRYRKRTPRGRFRNVYRLLYPPYVALRMTSAEAEM